MDDKILYQVVDQSVLDAHPDEWGVTIHCSNPKSIGYATTLTPSLIQQAAGKHLDLIVTHHDTWDFMREQRPESHNLLAQHQISHIWCHAPLDMADFGTSAALLEAIGCREIGKIVDDCGRIGQFQTELGLNRLIEMLEAQLSEKPARLHDTGKPILRVASVTGAGIMIDYLTEALEWDIDLYITGETNLYLLEYARYHGINVLVYSHNYTEIFGTQNLASKIAKCLDIKEIHRLDEPHY
jgi:putative NIF3 family GTP cyclohydrolase 1 type 2